MKHTKVAKSKPIKS